MSVWICSTYMLEKNPSDLSGFLNTLYDLEIYLSETVFFHLYYFLVSQNVRVNLQYLYARKKPVWFIRVFKYLYDLEIYLYETVFFDIVAFALRPFSLKSYSNQIMFCLLLWDHSLIRD